MRPIRPLRHHCSLLIPTLLLLPLLLGLGLVLGSVRALAGMSDMSPTESLYLAVTMDDLDETGRLLDQGLDPNEPDSHGGGCTALSYAASPEMLALLLEHGADPNKVCPDGLTALHVAVTSQDALQTIPLILEHGGRVNAEYMGDMPLHWAVIGWVEYFSSTNPDTGEQVIRLLAEAGADLDAIASYGITALMIATQNNEPELVRLLLELGADPGVKNASGMTALDMARQLDMPDMIEILSPAH